ncbi:unnamed protein product, partial [Urochloa humidicola]
GGRRGGELPIVAPAPPLPGSLLSPVGRSGARRAKRPARILSGQIWRARKKAPRPSLSPTRPAAVDRSYRRRVEAELSKLRAVTLHLDEPLLPATAHRSSLSAPSPSSSTSASSPPPRAVPLPQLSILLHAVFSHECID